MGEDEDFDSGWAVQGMLVFAGRWGHINLLQNERGRWQFVVRLTKGEEHSTCASHEEFDTLPMAKTAVDIHAESEGLRGVWGMVAMMTRLRKVGSQTWSASIVREPPAKRWVVSHVANVNFLAKESVLESVLAQHSHTDSQFFDDWDAALAYADAWHPPEFQTLCSCIGELR